MIPEERREAEEMEARLVDALDDDLPDELNAITERIIGAAIEVHRRLGPGWLEITYERALAREFELRGIAFERQKPVALIYKDVEVGEGRMDFLVEGRVIVEVKAIDAIVSVHRAQCIAYLRTTGHPLCLLINFNCATLKDGVRRLAWTRRAIDAAAIAREPEEGRDAEAEARRVDECDDDLPGVLNAW